MSTNHKEAAMSSISTTLGRGRFEAPRWLAIALALVTVAIIVAAVLRIATPSVPASSGERAPGAVAVYPASGRADFHAGLTSSARGHEPSGLGHGRRT